MNSPTLETRKRLKWWQWLAVAIVLLAVARVAWRFRPLNAMERQLVGTWDIQNDQWDGFITFTEDRSFTFLFRGRNPEASWEIPDIVGAWSVSGQRLNYTYDSPTRDLWSFLKREWLLFATGKSRTTSILWTAIEATSEKGELSRKPTDSSAAVKLKPLSAIDRDKLGLDAPSITPVRP